jgi:serine/threonine protein kinase
LQDIQDANGPRKPREIKRDTIRLLDELGHGNFGTVNKATLAEIRGQPGYTVAVKVLHQGNGVDTTALLQEAAVMAQFQHDRVVGLIGVITAGSPIMVVMEYCEHGALNNYLARSRLSLRRQLVIASDCADGLAYLASRRFVHRDIAARNVLVSSDKRAKIADFGLSRETNASDYYRARGGQMPIRWTAPEALEEGKFTTASDVWSFGILMYEIWTQGATPYGEIQSLQMVHIMVVNGYRLTCPEGCPLDVHAVMMECWHAEPINRPSFPELRSKLAQLESIGLPSMSTTSSPPETRGQTMQSRQVATAPAKPAQLPAADGTSLAGSLSTSEVPAGAALNQDALSKLDQQKPRLSKLAYATPNTPRTAKAQAESTTQVQGGIASDAESHALRLKAAGSEKYATPRARKPKIRAQTHGTQSIQHDEDGTQPETSQGLTLPRIKAIPDTQAVAISSHDHGESSRDNDTMTASPRSLPASTLTWLHRDTPFDASFSTHTEYTRASHAVSHSQPYSYPNRAETTAQSNHHSSSTSASTQEPDVEAAPLLASLFKRAKRTSTDV